APVSGGVSGARAATLAIMVGGDAEPLQKATPVLRAIGPNIFHVGPVGAGNTVKAINNMCASVNSCAMMEGLALGVKAGLDPMTVYQVVKASSGGSQSRWLLRAARYRQSRVRVNRRPLRSASLAASRTRRSAPRGPGGRGPAASRTRASSWGGGRGWRE